MIKLVPQPTLDLEIILMRTLIPQDSNKHKHRKISCKLGLGERIN